MDTLEKDCSLLDGFTGELLKFQQTIKISMEDFIRFCIVSQEELATLTESQIKVLSCCWRNSAYNKHLCSQGNVIYNDKLFKESCREQGINMSDAFIDKVICQLSKQGVLIKLCKGMYILNPKYFFKGTLSDRARLQYNITFESEKRDNA